VYQSSHGGKQYSVLDSSAGLVGVSTPRWAKMVSWKYTHLPSQQVEEDLRENHGRDTNRTHIQSVSDDVGKLLLAQASTVTYIYGIAKHFVKSISIGRDGAMLKLKEGQYREAMSDRRCGRNIEPYWSK
jgi:hypothetical protein